MLPRLIALISQPGTLTVADLACKLDTSPEMVSSAMERLAAAGYLRPVAVPGQAGGCHTCATDTGKPGGLQSCAQGCASCSLASSCSTQPLRAWVWTGKPRGADTIP